MMIAVGSKADRIVNYYNVPNDTMHVSSLSLTKDRCKRGVVTWSVSIHSSTDPRNLCDNDLIRVITERYSLNTEQKSAFQIVTDHAVSAHERDPLSFF